MASIVFFRAVNVGGHRSFQPARLASELRAFDVVNVGAAGTFVVREEVSEKRLREAILARLPFRPELMICPAGEVLALIRDEPLAGASAAEGVGPFVSVLHQAPRPRPRLPLSQPAGEKWEVRIVAITGRFVLSLRRSGRTYPNAVVEKVLGVLATTRNWNTFETLGEVLRAGTGTCS
jgi:uncharacterized protein (DUF1697 family)